MRRSGGYALLAALTAPTVADAAAADEKRMRGIAATYATCVVRKHHNQASEAVLATASNKDIINKMSQIVDGDCLGDAAGHGVDMRFPNDTYQYALADALVRSEFAADGPTSFDDRLPLAQDPVMTAEEQEKRVAEAKPGRDRDGAKKAIVQRNAVAWLRQYGECVVRRDPIDARYWLLTPTDTPEEVSRIKAMQPAMGACLGEGTLHFSRTAIRGTVAINYYRLARATKSPATGSVH